MSYRYQGDYLYARGRGGFPLIGGLIAKVAPKLIAGAGKLLGIGGKTVTPAIAPIALPTVARTVPAVAAPTVGSILKNLPIFGGAAVGAVGAMGISALLGGKKKRRTMNPLNPKALSRATRRLCGFRDKSKKALSELGYTVTRTGVAHRCTSRKKCG